jgi:hypothetical protein
MNIKSILLTLFLAVSPAAFSSVIFGDGAGNGYAFSATLPGPNSCSASPLSATANNFANFYSPSSFTGNFTIFTTTLNGVPAFRSGLTSAMFTNPAFNGCSAGNNHFVLVAPFDVNGTFIDESVNVGTVRYMAFAIYIPSTGYYSVQAEIFNSLQSSVVGFANGVGNLSPWGIIAQLHGPNGQGPGAGPYSNYGGQSPDFALALDNSQPSSTTVAGTGGCPVVSDITNNSGDPRPLNYSINYNTGQVPGTNVQCFFTTNSAVVTNQWTSFIVAINLQGTATGYIKVYRSDAGSGAYTKVIDIESIATLMYDPAVDGSSATNLMCCHAWSWGSYRQSSHPSTYYLSAFTLGNDWASVQLAAFGTAFSQP